MDMNTLHLGEVDHQAAVRHSLTRHAVAAAANRDLEPRFARECNRVDDVRRPMTTCDQRGPLVDQAVVYLARLLVAVVIRVDDRTGKGRGKRLEPLSVDSCRCGHPSPSVA